MKFTDAAAIVAPRMTRDGYLAASVRCARTGCQDYLGAEMGRPDLARVTVYRPEGAVFARDSLETFAGKPVTMGHPSDPVTADNWKSHAVGAVGEDVVRDGDFVRVSLALMDGAAIQAVQGGQREISMGYEAAVSFEDGTAPDGTPYQAVMRDLRINHLAVVPRARGGAELRIGDGAEDSGTDRTEWGAAPLPINDMKGRHMADLRTVVVGDEAVETTDQGARAIESLKTKLSDAVKAHDTALAAKDATIAARDARIAELETQVLDGAALDAKVAERADLIARAKTVAPSVVTDGLDANAIMRAALKARLSDAEIDNKPDAYVSAYFDILAKDAKPVDPLRTIGTVVANDGGDGWDKAFKSAGLKKKDAR